MGDETFGKVKDILVEYLHVDAEKVTPDARFIEDLEADLSAWSSSCRRWRTSSGSTIPDEDAEKLVTVQNAIDYIESGA